MGLRSDIQTALTDAMVTDLSDIVVAFTLVKNSEGIYNTATGLSPDIETLYTSKGIFQSFGAREIDGTNIKSEDEKLIINGADISTAPEIDDIIRLASGKEMIVIKPNPVMGGETMAIIYEVQIRKN